MARSDLVAIGAFVASGLDPAVAQEAANVDGNMFLNNGKILLWLENGSGSPITVTLVTPRTVSGLAVADQTVSVPATDERWAGPFDTGTYNQASGADVGKLYIDYSDVTTLNVGAYAVP